LRSSEARVQMMLQDTQKPICTANVIVLLSSSLFSIKKLKMFKIAVKDAFCTFAFLK